MTSDPEVIERLNHSLADRYRIEYEIGSGGMATVYLAQDLKHHRRVALKTLRPELAATLGSGRFVREIEIAAKLSHPHILPLHDSGEAGGILYYVMPYVEGETLRERLDREGRLSVAEAVRLTDEIASALSYAHEQGIVHRDVKPENILLSGGRAVVADFGIGRAISVAGGEGLTGTGFAVGTPAYMSPEQAFGDGSVDGRSDVYALGCVAYEMVAGHAPFEADTPQALLAKQAAETVPSLRATNPAIPLFVERAVERALAKSPDERFRTASEFAEALTSEMVVARAGRRQGSWLAVAGATIVLVAAASLVLLNVLGGPQYERLAVLPPTNRMNDPEQEWFVEGMHEDLITELNRAGGVTVIARTSVMQFRDGLTPIREIAQKLGVDAVIETSVFRAGDSVEMEARVVDGATQALVGDPIVRRNALRDVERLHRGLTAAIAAEIQLELTPQAEARLASAEPVNPEAYEDYLNGRFHWNSLTQAGMETALGYFQQALEKEPDFAQAQAGIAQVWAGRNQMGYATPDEAGPKAREALARALTADSTLFEVQYTAALIRTWVNWDWQGGEAAFRKAIDLNPNSAEARAYYANLLSILGRDAECEEQIERAMELDPLSPLILLLSGNMHAGLGRFDEAISMYMDLLRTSPDYPSALVGLEGAYYRKGMHEEALEVGAREFAQVFGQDITAMLRSAYAEGGPEEAWLLAAEAGLAASGGDIPPHGYVRVARLFDRAGQADRALFWLERAYETRHPTLPSLNKGFSETLRDDPRFVSLRERMNLPH